MEQSITRKKLDSELTEFFHVIRDFAINEVYEMSKVPGSIVVYPVTDKNILVGRFRVSYQDGGWRVSNYFDEVLHDFYSKPAAIYFALAMMKQHFKLADRLRLSDANFQAAKNEYVLYDKRTKATTDDFKFHLYLCKLEESKSRLRMYASEMEESLKSAKYLNNSGT